MILNTLAATIALLSLNFSEVSTPAKAVESVSVVSTASYAAKLDYETEWTLISEHAAPHWNLTTNEAWALYDDGVMIITEVIAGSTYKISYGGGLLTVVLESGH